MPIADPEKRRKYDQERSRQYYLDNRERIIARQIARQRASRARNRPSKTCQKCGSSFTEGGRKYCSDPCRKRAARETKTRLQREYDAKPGAAQARSDKAREWWRALDPERAWAYTLKGSHGMQPEQWHAMFMEQRGLCYLCERPLPDDRAKIAIDHDHGHCPPNRSCGVCRRGLAHHQCNSGIGLLGEDPALLRLIADNLERAKQVTSALLIAAPVQGELFAGDSR